MEVFLQDQLADPESGFATAYDIIYDGPASFYRAQLGFLCEQLGLPPGRVLDVGCGTGRQLAALAQHRYDVTGLDLSRAMLQRARARLDAQGTPANLLQADLRALPCAAPFDSLLCLESPLAYVLDDADLAHAATGFARVLRPGGRLIIDVFDYPAAIGPDGSEPQTSYFRTAEGAATVLESHTCDGEDGVWRMRQEFRLQTHSRQAHFSVEHVFSLRNADAYAAALEAAGFAIESVLEQYPAVTAEVEHERRMIIVGVR